MAQIWLAAALLVLVSGCERLNSRGITKSLDNAVSDSVRSNKCSAKASLSEHDLLESPAVVTINPPVGQVSDETWAGIDRQIKLALF